MKQNKVMASIILIWMMAINITFEIVMFMMNLLKDDVLKVPIEFFLYSLLLTVPMARRVMALIQPAHKGNVIFNLSKYMYNIYYILLFVSTLCKTSLLMGIRWFFYIFVIVNIIKDIYSGDYEVEDKYKNEQSVLSFQLTCFIYLGVVIMLCNFRISCLTIAVIVENVIFANLLRIYVMRKRGMFGSGKRVVGYIGAALLELVAYAIACRFYICYSLAQFQEMLYELPATIYVDVVVASLVLLFFELPLYRMRGRMWKELEKNECL